MEALLQRLLNIQGEGCITIIAPTHRIKTEIKQDELVVKNLVKEAEDRLLGLFEKNFAQPIIDNLHRVIASIDFSHNLDALLIFASPTLAEYITLPTEVKARVVIDNTFATRDLIRAISELPIYYVLVLTRKLARLIYAVGDKVVEEAGNPFPLENQDYERLRSQLPPDRVTASAVEGFFHEVDKAVASMIKQKPRPLIVAAATRNFSLLEKISSHKDLIAGSIPLKSDTQKAHAVVAEAWPVVVRMLQEYNQGRLKELEKAISAGRFLNDYSEVWEALTSGRGGVLFVKKGFHQPAAFVNGRVALIEKAVKDAKGVVEDIIDEMIEQALAYGGEVVYINGPELDRFNGIALITRY
ncbi:MAG: hypothetical protein ACP5O2_04385 [Bacteroidales bacterium]